MRYVVMMLTASLVASALGQQPTPIRPGQLQRAPQQPQAAGPAPLQDEAKLEFLVARLGLDEEQETKAQVLLDEYRVAYNDTSQMDMQLLSDLLKQYSAAQAANDDASAEALRREIEEARPSTQARRQFMAGLTLVLTDAQKQRLADLEAWLEKHPTGKMSPGDILAEVMTMELSAEQHRRLGEVHRQFRERAARMRPTEITSSNMEQEFAAAVREVLTAEQQTAFDKRIAVIAPPANASS